MHSTDYSLLERQLLALSEGETDRLAMCANFVGLLYAEIDDINWLGIYVLRNDELVLGPFQGKPACVRIPLGQGVCGTAAGELQTVLVDDVHSFAGHIVCDPASKSELVVPLIAGGRLLGVLDIDSPTHGRFTQSDRLGVESLCRELVRLLGREQAQVSGFI